MRDVDKMQSHIFNHPTLNRPLTELVELARGHLRYELLGKITVKLLPAPPVESFVIACPLSAPASTVLPCLALISAKSSILTIPLPRPLVGKVPEVYNLPRAALPRGGMPLVKITTTTMPSLASTRVTGVLPLRTHTETSHKSFPRRAQASNHGHRLRGRRVAAAERYLVSRLRPPYYVARFLSHLASQGWGTNPFPHYND